MQRKQHDTKIGAMANGEKTKRTGRIMKWNQIDGGEAPTARGERRRRADGQRDTTS